MRQSLGLALFASLASAETTAAPVVDLGYAIYQGVYNTAYDQNIFNGYVYESV